MDRVDRAVFRTLWTVGTVAKAAIMLHATIVAVHGLVYYYKEFEKWVDGEATDEY